MFQHRHLLRALWEISAPRKNRRSPEPDIPVILAQAQKELEQCHSESREQVVRAITQSNNVVQLVGNLTYQRNRCEDIAIEAEDRSDSYMAARYRHRQAAYQEALDSVQDVVAETEKAAQMLHTQIALEQLEVEARLARLQTMKEEWQVRQAGAAMGRQLQAEARYLVDETYNHYSLKAARDIIGALLAGIAALLCIVLVLVLR